MNGARRLVDALRTGSDLHPTGETDPTVPGDDEFEPVLTEVDRKDASTTIVTEGGHQRRGAEAAEGDATRGDAGDRGDLADHLAFVLFLD